MPTKNEIYILVTLLTVNLVLSCDDAMQLSYSANNDILTMKCKIVCYTCCTDVNGVEFIKNDDDVCSVSGCDGRQDIPQNRDDTIFYSCGCSGQNIRNVFFLTTEMKESDIGKWQCRSRNTSGDVECKSNVITVDMSKEEEDTVIEAHLILTVVMFLVLVTVVVAFIAATCRFKRRGKGTSSSPKGQELVGVWDPSEGDNTV